MKRLLALLAALTVLLALAGCGAGGDESAQEDSAQVGETLPEEDAGELGEPEELPQEEAEDAGESDSAADGEAAGEGAGKPDAPEDAGMTLSRTDFTLFKVGSSYRLTAAGVDAACTYTSSDPGVASVGEDGTVTAVAPGKAVITVTSGSETRTCVVRCSWTAEEPADAPVDLSAFYQDITEKYTFQTLQEFTGEILDAYYPGMSSVATNQCLIMGTMMTMNNGEFCLAEVKDGADVDAVKGIFQDRVDYMAESGAWYPGPTELWTNSSRVVSHGNFVMMVVHESCDQIVEDFNALFQ